MAIFKCKMCGGDIQAEINAAFGTCDSCGVTSTLPKANDDKLVNLFNRANHFRRLNEFDKAIAIYENILNEDATNAEAHWCVVLCRYGIEYVEDPKTYQCIPTCHRTQFASILTDADYLAALENASDSYAKGLYEAEAKKINEIQKGILAISSQEQPYDIFICYKETTDGGSRTKDSTIAQDIYHQLADDYKVFFAKITLEDKLGQEYEPYIFNALNSAKVMLVLGTKKEHFEAVWVKNEWSRFLAIMKNDRSRLLIPCYRDMDAYDIPDELAHFQALDMEKIGFVQDLTRGIKKIFDDANKIETPVAPGASDNTAASTDNLMKRGNFLLEDREWAQATEYFERMLEANPENAEAYLGKLCAELKLCKHEDLSTFDKPLSDISTFNRAMRFAGEPLRAQLEGYDKASKENHAHYAFCKQMKGKIAAGTRKNYGVTFDGKAVEISGGEQSEVLWSVFKSAPTDIVAISCGKDYEMVAIKKDGTVVAPKGGDIVKKWNNIVEIATGYDNYLVALGSNGKLVTNIIFITSDGRILRKTDLKELGRHDWRYKLSEALQWNDLVSVDMGHRHVVALGRDGIVHTVGNEETLSCYTNEWQGIIAIAAGEDCTAGLSNRGTVIFSGTLHDVDKAGLFHTSSDKEVQKNFTIPGWENIMAISAGHGHIVGLKRDGSVVAYGYNTNGQCNVSEWSNIVAVSAGAAHTLGLKRDGTLVAVGGEMSARNVSAGWNIGVKTPFTQAEVKQKNLNEAKTQEKSKVEATNAGTKIAEDRAKMSAYEQHQNWRSKSLCGYCGGSLSAEKCTQCNKDGASGWDKHGKFERIKELGLGMAFVQMHRDWCSKGHCYNCGHDKATIFGKCKNCEHAEMPWKSVEDAIIERYKAVYNLGFSAEDYHIASTYYNKNPNELPKVSPVLSGTQDTHGMGDIAVKQTLCIMTPTPEELQKVAEIVTPKILRDKENMKQFQIHEDWRKKNLCGYCGGKLSILDNCKQCKKNGGAGRNGWEVLGKYERIKELGVGMAYIQSVREWYNEKGMTWDKARESELATKCGVEYNLGFTADDYHNVASGKIKMRELRDVITETPSTEPPNLSGISGTLGTTDSVPIAESVPEADKNVGHVDSNNLPPEPETVDEAELVSEPEVADEVEPVSEPEAVNDTMPGNTYKVGQTVFARWDGGDYYFPGIISAVNGSHLDIAYLDGEKETVPIADVLELNEALQVMQLEGNWKNTDNWYGGRISNNKPLTMSYDDGDVEQIELSQLRGTLH